MMDPGTFERLRHVYYGRDADSVWDDEHGRTRQRRPGSMPEATWRELLSGPYPPNDFRRLDHDEIVARTLAADARVSWEEVFDGFVLGCGKAWPRGRQTLISAAHARHLCSHDYVNPDADGDDDVCHVCGVPRRVTIDHTDAVCRLYWGYAWNETAELHHVDLAERAEVPTPEVGDEERAAFVTLLRAIAAADADETPGQLEKRIAKAKLLPGTDKYRRYGILLALGEVGVLPNELVAPSYDRLVPRPELWAASKKAKTSFRSDIVLPLAGWRGHLAIDWERAQELFGDRVTPG